MLSRLTDLICLAIENMASCYTYGYLDKVLSVTENDRTITYAYHPDGQLASANYGRARSPSAPQVEDSPSFETFAWDGLALIRRGDEQFVNEPHIGGGNPVASSKGTTHFNDLLGTTAGAKSGATYTAAALSAFGEDLNHHSPTPTSNSHSFYTGKPHVAGLGHVFLMRNYRAGLAKWQTADPMGCPENAPQKLCFGGKPRAQRSARRAKRNADSQVACGECEIFM